MLNMSIGAYQSSIMPRFPIQSNRVNPASSFMPCSNTPSKTSTASVSDESTSSIPEFYADYEKWKAAQDPQVLPDSKGPTEENMAYLRDRYSGPLTMFQKMEAFDTMLEMGIITEAQHTRMCGTCGPNLVAWHLNPNDPDFYNVKALPLDTTIEGDWSNMVLEYFYKLTPLAKSEDLDDMFSWVDEIVFRENAKKTDSTDSSEETASQPESLDFAPGQRTSYNGSYLEERYNKLLTEQAATETLRSTGRMV